MPLYRVNIRQIETSHVVVQVEVEAEDEAHAVAYAHLGIYKKEFTFDKEYVSTKIRRLGPETYTVMDARPLQLMDQANKRRWVDEPRTDLKTWKGEAHEISLPDVEKVEMD